MKMSRQESKREIKTDLWREGQEYDTVGKGRWKMKEWERERDRTGVKCCFSKEVIV
jgi:hypothetical protein